MNGYTLDNLVSFINRVNATHKEYKLLDEEKCDIRPFNRIELNFFCDKPFIKCYYDQKISAYIMDYIIAAEQFDEKTFRFRCCHGKEYKAIKSSTKNT